MTGDTMTDAELQRLRELAEAASKGPWYPEERTDSADPDFTEVYGADGDVLLTVAGVRGSDPYADASYIVALVNAAPALLSRLAAVEEALRTCPWCGHPPMCHNGPEGECVSGAAALRQQPEADQGGPE